MTRMTPFDDMNRVFDRMSRGFDDAWDDNRVGGFDIDLAEYDDELVVVADLPGYDTDEIDVNVHDGRLTIAAEHSMEHQEGDESGEGAYLRRERRSASARRSVPLPAEVREEDASATYTNGVLTVTLPTVTDDGDDDSHHIDVN